MRTTLMTARPKAAAQASTSVSNKASSDAAAAGEAQPPFKVQYLIGLLAALALLGGGVAQQHASRASAEAASADAAAAFAERAAPETPAESLAPPASFAALLQAGYLDLASEAYDRRAYAPADFYARRSVAAGATPPPAPMIAAPGAPSAAIEARIELMNAFTLGAATRAPAAMAEAQVGFDCWLRESEPDGRPERMLACAEKAKLALESLATAHGAPTPPAAARDEAKIQTPTQTPSPTPSPAPSPTPSPAPSASLSAWMERWGPHLDMSTATTWALAEPVAASMRPGADAAKPVETQAAAAPAEAPARVYPAYEAASYEAPADEASADDASAAAEPASDASLLAAASAGASAEARAEMRRADAAAAFVIERRQAAAQRALPAPELLTAVFAFGSDELAAEGAAALAQRLDHLGAAKAARIIVHGHADAAGPSGFNMGLSQRRADAAAALVRGALGPQGPSVEAIAFGETQLKVATADGVAEPRNRRVEIKIIR
ncbi:MAG: OmpA family protein [Pseudomonadota bacterium]